MTLGKNTESFFNVLEKNPGPLFWELPDIESVRKILYPGFAGLSTDFPKGTSSADYQEFMISTPGNLSLRAARYMPADLYNTISIPTLVYFYGGGFCLDLFDFQKGACANIANNASCQVIMISPPLAPEYSAQEIIGACYDSVNYLYINAKKYNIDKSNFMLSGCSSGGTIAALVTNLASNRSDFVVSQQILISPLVDLSLETHNSNPLIGFQKKDLMLTDEGLRYFVNSFLHKDSDGGKSSKVSPIYDLSKSQLKHTLTTIIVGEYDALRGDGATYASHAQELGFPTELITLDGQTHNFLSCRKVLNDGIDPALMAANKIKDNLVINPLPLRCKL